MSMTDRTRRALRKQLLPLQLLLLRSVAASEGHLGGCFPTRLCGYTVKLFSDARCSAPLAHEWVAPGGCFADRLLALQPYDTARDEIQEGKVGSVYAQLGVTQALYDGVGYWSAPNGSVYCGEYNPTLYFSKLLQSDIPGTESNEGCIGRCVALESMQVCTSMSHITLSETFMLVPH
eukprot:6185081-Pleurochrysis_carterae.AAC.3